MTTKTQADWRIALARTHLGAFDSRLVEKLKEEGFKEVAQVEAKSGKILLDVTNVPDFYQKFDAIITPKTPYLELRIVDMSVIDTNYKPEKVYKVFAKK